MTRTLRTTLWGIGAGLAIAGFLTYWMPYAWVLIVIGGTILVAAGLFESLADAGDVGWESTVFGRDAADWDRVIANGGLE